MNEAGSSPVLTVENLAVSFGGRDGAPAVRAVSSASMTLYPRQTLAVVGESGSGKSVTALSALQLIPRPPGRFDRGRILLHGVEGTATPPRDLLTMPQRDIRAVRGGEIAMIFQEPMTSLNPVFTIGQQITEAVLLHQGIGKAAARETAIAAMDEVGITNPAERLDAYPHQFSGGMRQRVMIAMALACHPRILLADEPTTALDVTIQAQILELLRGLQERKGLAIMLITHALGVVAQNADVVAVMYGGRVVEYAGVTELFENPQHPYTRGLLASIPHTRHRVARLTTIRELVSDPAQFQRYGEGHRPWWPDHAPAAGTIADPATDVYSVLAEITPGHWVALWRTPEALNLPCTFPDLR
ncbi:MAG: ABC transporter ATP-binding protein, partial [Phycisphaerales bacterium]|nr:ABC transporter ATP-binding protein [Phycisphaerales bacterium]